MTFELQFYPSKSPPSPKKLIIQATKTKLNNLHADITDRGFLTKENLKTVCLRKTTISQSRVGKNVSADVEAITKICFSTENERLRIGSLLLIKMQVARSKSSIILLSRPMNCGLLFFNCSNLIAQRSN
jgi:hypothetical protein